MYIPIACLVLFDARGTLPDMGVVFLLAACMQLILLAMTHFPQIIHRPSLVDALCADLLAFAANGAGVCLLHRYSDLQYACVLHTVCFLVQTKYLERCSASSSVCVHLLMVIMLLAAYSYGPRVTDLQQFVFSAVWPHLLEHVAQALVMVHKVAVTHVSDI